MLSRLVSLLVLFTAVPLWAQDAGSLRITNLTSTPDGWSLGWEHSATGTAYTVQFQDAAEDQIWRIPPSSAL